PVAAIVSGVLDQNMSNAIGIAHKHNFADHRRRPDDRQFKVVLHKTFNRIGAQEIESSQCPRKLDQGLWRRRTRVVPRAGRGGDRQAPGHFVEFDDFWSDTALTDIVGILQDYRMFESLVYSDYAGPTAGVRAAVGSYLEKTFDECASSEVVEAARYSVLGSGRRWRA